MINLKELEVETRREFPEDDVMLTLIQELRRCADALNFYADRDNLDIDGHGSSINFDPNYPEWRIGPSYLKSAEQGQRAFITLAELKKKVKL